MNICANEYTFFFKKNLGASHEYANCELILDILTLKILVNNLRINTSQVCFLYFILQWCKLNGTVSLKACSINSFTDTEKIKTIPLLQQRAQY